GGGAGTAWADALGGMASDLGLPAGSPAAVRLVPGSPGLPSLVAVSPFSP
ncbi:MAG: hypothetical protein GXP55_01540, partial [Deltaproteobacteria bacterium]|nr:hypothetical protein [Deltaproteobacteria bacterium]